MIKRQILQLFSFRLWLFILIVIPLVGFFTLGIYVDHSMFIFLSVGLLVGIIFLVPLRNRLVAKFSSTQIQVQDITERINLVDAEIKNEEETIQSFESKILDASQLKGLTEKLSMCLSLEDTSKTLSSEASKLYGSEDTTIILYLFHSKTGELGISSSQRGQISVNLKTKKGDEFDQWVIRTMQPLLIEDARSDYRFDIDKIAIEDSRPVRSLIGVPLVAGSKVLGILRVDSPKAHYFAVEDLRFLTAVGDLGALAIENAQLYERIQQLAIRDSLTNVYLRRYLMERLPEEISRHIRSKHQLSFMMIDLDKFKEYNDKFGHMAGDIVLKAVSAILADTFVQPGDLVCRYGGEEFAVLLPDCPKAKAMQLAEELRKKIEAESIVLRREKTHITVSIGVAAFPSDASEKDELIQKADAALYRAKKEGRNRVIDAGKGGKMTSALLVLGVVGYIALFIFIGRRITARLESDADQRVVRAENTFKDIVKKKDTLYLKRMESEEEAFKIFTLYEITKDITKSLSEKEAFEIFKSKLPEHASFEECLLIDIADVKNYKNKKDYFIFELQTPDRKIGYLVFKHLSPKHEEVVRILGHQFALAMRRVLLYEEIGKVAITDALTELYTRRYILQRLEEELARAQARKSKMSFLMIDVDYFKSINDRYGHLTGDQVLRRMGKIIKENIREIDIAGRYGGEEFCVVLPDTDLAGAQYAAERIRSACERTPIKAYDATINTTSSLGIATFPDHGKTVNELIDKADWALYRSKKRGRNLVSYFGYEK